MKNQSRARRTTTPSKRSGAVANVGKAERPLNKQTVVAAALLEIDRHGLDNFSLRNVAKSLGVYPSAVTWHVKGRTQLLAEVAALAFADVPPPGFPKSWQAYLREFFERFRTAIRQHPYISPLIGTQLVGNRAFHLDFVERLLAALQHAGFSGTSLVAAYNTVIAAVVGFATQEYAPIPQDDLQSWQRAVRDRLEHVPASRYPLLAQNMKLLQNRAFMLRWQNGTQAPLDDSFVEYVEFIIAGLESRIRLKS